MVLCPLTWISDLNLPIGIEKNLAEDKSTQVPKIQAPSSTKYDFPTKLQNTQGNSHHKLRTNDRTRCSVIG